MIGARTPPLAVALLASWTAGVGAAQDEADRTEETAAAAADAGAGGAEPPQLEPIVVTARKWLEDVQSVPQSVTVVGESAIRDGGIKSVRDAAMHVPNLLMTEFTSRRLSFPFVRGIGSGQGDPAVVTYLDGVSQLSVSATNVPLLETERIEFLRGPESTLYGRNALGGVIHVISRRPTNTPRLFGDVTFGNFDFQEYRLGWSGPFVADELYLSLAGMYSRRDGYTINDLTGQDVDSRDAWFGRGQLLWTPGERTEVRMNVYGESAQDGGFALFDLDALRSRPNRIAVDFDGFADRQIAAGSITVDHSADGFDLTSISQIQDWDINEATDFDFTALDGVRRFTDESQQNFTQEVRLSSPQDKALELGEGAALRWLLGGLFFVDDTDQQAANEFRPGGAGIIFPPANVGTDTAGGSFDDWSAGVFGQLTLTLAERLDLTAGLRYDFEHSEAEIERTFQSGPFTVPLSSSDLSEDFDEVLPSFSVAYRLTDDLLAWGRAARGFKAGGFNLTAPSGSETFDAETNWCYEAGLKSTWFDERLILNGSIFHIDWDDMQLSQFSAQTGGFVTNAGESRSRGVELEATARVSEGLDCFGSFGYVDSEFDRFVDQFGLDNSGNDLPFAPESTWSVGSQYRARLGSGLHFVARAEYASIGDFFYDASNLASESYGIANFRVGLEAERWHVEFWVRNAFEDDYVPVAFQPNPADPTMFVGESGAPRTMGITCGVRF